jgi:YidC/Oxa1 family membrane protein insertase
MKLQVSLVVAAVGATSAFAPAKFATRPQTARSFGVEPSMFHDLPNHVQSLQDAFSTISVSDAMGATADAFQATSDAAASTAAGAVEATTDAAVDAAANQNGGFGFLTGPISSLLTIIHSGIVAVGGSANAWGVSIIVLTLLIKLLTFPLTKTQLESTNKMQALQPLIKDIQAKYESNPEVMNQKISEIYSTNKVNPLAGCLPSVVQIPVFIGLYRAVLDLAKQDKLNEAFFFLPNLEGPIYGGDASEGSSWLFNNWVDGVPSLGWDDTLSFLILPVFLVISQFVSMELMQPKDKDAAPQQGAAVLKFLPLMIGWFSLNVPAALCLYWVTNNVVTTATTVIIKKTMKMEPAAATDSSDASAPLKSDIFAPAPMREKPVGFKSQAGSSSDGVKPITAIDAEVVADNEEGAPSESSKSSSKKGKKTKN